MSTSNLSLFTFRLDGDDPEAPEFACLAASTREAEGRARAAGHRSFSLVSAIAVDPGMRAGINRRLAENPLLGPDWSPLVDVLEIVMKRVLSGRPWTFHIYGAAYGYDPSVTPGAQSILEADGSLLVEITGPAPRHLSNLAKALEFMGWTPPIGDDGRVRDDRNAHQLFAPGWTDRGVAVALLEVLTSVYAIGREDFFHFGDEIADDVESLGLLERAGEGPQFRLVAVAKEREAAVTEAAVAALLEASRSITYADRNLLKWEWCNPGRTVQRREVTMRLRPALGREWRQVRDELADAPEFAKTGFTVLALLDAIRALRARHEITADGFSAGDYSVLTEPWASVVGKVHPDDPDIPSDICGPQTEQIRNLLLQVANLTPRHRFLLPLAHDHDPYDRNAANANARQEGLDRVRPLGIIEIPGEELDGAADDVVTEALLGLCLRDLADTEGPFTIDNWRALTNSWAMVVGPVHPDDGEMGGNPQWVNGKHMTQLLSKIGQLSASQMAELDGPDDPTLVGAREAAWTAAWREQREGPWSRGTELRPQAAADAADALIARDMTDGHPFTSDHYRALTARWRAVIGPVHPDDVDPSIASQDEGDGEDEDDIERVIERVVNLSDGHRLPGTMDEDEAESIYRFCDRAGLCLPYVPERMGSDLIQMFDENNFGTHTRPFSPTRLYSFRPVLNDIFDGDWQPKVQFGFSGHGMNSYAFTYVLIADEVAILAQVAGGGIFADQPATAREWKAMMGATRRLHEVATRADIAPAHDAIVLAVWNRLRGGTGMELVTWDGIGRPRDIAYKLAAEDPATEFGPELRAFDDAIQLVNVYRV